jgi:hypothetical protein
MSIDRPLTRCLTSPLTRAITDAGGGGNLPLPSGFDWTPPISVYRSGATFGTSYDAVNFKPATTAELWASPTGNDTTGDGTQGLPYRSIKKALQQAALLPDSGIRVRVVAGTYDFNNCWGGITPDKHLVVTAEGGEVVSSTRASVTWTLQGDGTYRCSRTNAVQVYDTTHLNARGKGRRLAKVADQATCAATADSWYTDATFVYVHTFDNRVPTNNDLIVLLGTSNGTQTVAKTYYVSGVVFEGGNANGPFNTPSTGAGGSLVFDGCTFRYGNATGSAANGLTIYGVASVISVNCLAHDNALDGFNYHQGSSNLVSPKVVEVNCASYDNGSTADAVNNDNGSTSHEDCRVLRVNTIAAGNIGPQIVDVDTVKSWNLGCNASASGSTDATGTTNAAYYSGSASAAMFLDRCTGSSYYATVTTGTATLRTRNCTLTGLSSGDVAAY